MICIDPGLRGCGVAVFSEVDVVPQLKRAFYVKNPETSGRGPAVYARMARAVLANVCVGHARLVLELPRIYPGVREQDQNDLLDLAGVDGAIAMAFQHHLTAIIHVFPSEWKGQVPKAKMNARVLKQLSPAERDTIITAGSKDHNTLDAVGIGLYVLGRLNKKRSEE